MYGLYEKEDVVLSPSHYVRRSTFLTEQGFSLMEILLSLMIMVVALVPMMDSITGSFQSTRVGEQNTILVNYTREKMENILAMNFADVDISSPPGTPTALSDTVTILGETMNRDVLVELYDGDGDTIPDSDLKKITVIIDSIQQETLLANF